MYVCMYVCMYVQYVCMGDMEKFILSLLCKYLPWVV